MVCGLTALCSDRACSVGALALGCSGLAGRLLERGKVLLYEGMGERLERSSVKSSSACSGILGSIAKPLQDTGYDSSIALRRGLLRRPELRGEAGRRGVV